MTENNNHVNSLLLPNDIHSNQIGKKVFVMRNTSHRRNILLLIDDVDNIFVYRG